LADPATLGVVFLCERREGEDALVVAGMLELHQDSQHIPIPSTFCNPMSRMWSRNYVILGLLTGLAVLVVFMSGRQEHFNMMAQVIAERKNIDVSKMDADLASVGTDRPFFLSQSNLQEIGNSAENLMFANPNRSY
jgi:hypothetical protein